VKTKTVLRATAAAASLALIAVGVATPAQAADPGVSATEIVLGETTPLTGAASAGYSVIPQAQEAYFNYLNNW
jgi:hypothetical protein